MTSSDRPTEDHPLMMAMQRSIDLVQDVTTDCSVVAGLCALAERKGHTYINVCKYTTPLRLLKQTDICKILSNIFFPYDHILREPENSPSGKYIFRFIFNGTFRKVIVDDRLPSSHSHRQLYVVDRSNAALLWPALLEKAYLKVRGGYDFPGSNSGTDLWIITGWIPEQVFLMRYFDLE